MADEYNQGMRNKETSKEMQAKAKQATFEKWENRKARWTANKAEKAKNMLNIANRKYNE